MKKKKYSSLEDIRNEKEHARQQIDFGVGVLSGGGSERGRADERKGGQTFHVFILRVSVNDLIFGV